MRNKNSKHVQIRNSDSKQTEAMAVDAKEKQIQMRGNNSRHINKTSIMEEMDMRETITTGIGETQTCERQKQQA